MDHLSASLGPSLHSTLDSTSTDCRHAFPYGREVRGARREGRKEGSPWRRAPLLPAIHGHPSAPTYASQICPRLPSSPPRSTVASLARFRRRSSVGGYCENAFFFPCLRGHDPSSEKGLLLYSAQRNNADALERKEERGKAAIGGGGKKSPQMGRGRARQREFGFPAAKKITAGAIDA